MCFPISLARTVRASDLSTENPTALAGHCRDLPAATSPPILDDTRLAKAVVQRMGTVAIIGLDRQLQAVSATLGGLIGNGRAGDWCGRERP